MLSSHAHAPIEDRALDARTRAAFHFLANLLVNAWHTDKICGIHFLDGSPQIVEAGTVRDADAQREHVVVHMASGDVRERQKGYVSRLKRPLEGSSRGVQVGSDVAMCE